MTRVRAVLLAVLTAVAAFCLVGVDGGAARAAGPRPLFQLPVACGEVWRLATYVGHDDYDIDMTPTTGSAWGRPILASFAGTVIASGIDGTLGNRTPSNPNGPRGTGGGYYVKIDHGGGWHTLYLHMLERPMVAVGQRVTIGQQLGKVGSTGDSSGPHLHYEQRADNSKVESWFNGTPSGITHDNSNYSVQRTSNNCPSELYHNVRRADGEWTPFVPLVLPGVTAVSSAADAQGRLHVVVLRNGQIHHRLRHADQTWTGWGVLGGPATASTITSTVAPDGTLHVLTVHEGSVHHRVREPEDGEWTTSSPLGNPGPATAVAAAMDPNYNLHVAVLINGQVHHQMATATAWGQWRPLGNPGTASALSVATDSTGLLHLATVIDGSVHHRVRKPGNGNWTTSFPLGNDGVASAVAVATDSTGLLHLVAVNSGLVHHQVRRPADGGWTASLPLHPGPATAVSAAVDPAKDMHLTTAAAA